MRTLLFLALAAAPDIAAAQEAADAVRAETFRKQYAVYQAQVYRSLSASDDGLALVLASLLAATQPSALTGLEMQPAADSQLQRDLLVRRARKAAAHDVLVWWTLAGDCPASAAACDRASALERLREIEPDNAMVWLVDLPKDSPEEAATLNAALARVAQATRFDSHFVERAARYADLLASVEPSPELLATVPSEFMVPATAEGVQTMLALSFALAEATLPIRSVMNTCRDATDDAGTTRLSDCRKIATILTHASDSLIGAHIGIRLQLALARPGRERDEAERDERKLLWLQLAGGELQAGNEGNPSFARDMLARWREPGATELSMLQDLLSDHGVPLDPPADWSPSEGWQAQPAARPVR